MKVVGGPHDGLNVRIDPVHGQVRLSDPTEIDPTIDWLCSECGRIAPMTMKFTVYTVRRFRFGGGLEDYYEFLAPQGWSDKTAFLHQFGK